MLALESGTAAKYRNLKTHVVPPSRRLTKTNLAKYLNAWAEHPDLASLGGQKNFARFMEDIGEREKQGESVVPDAHGFKQMIGKVILFKQIHSLVRPMFPAFQGNVAIYLVALIAKYHGSTIDLTRVWEMQDISSGFKTQIRIWAREVHYALHATANGRMISEWAKKEDCWLALQGKSLTPAADSILEIK